MSGKIRPVTKLTPRPNAPGVFDVKGQHGDWVTIIRGQGRTCTCPDFIYRGFDGTTCKHIDAALILLEAEAKAFEIANTEKRRGLRRLVRRNEPTNFVEKEVKQQGFHYKGNSLYFGDSPIESFEDLERFKALLEID